MRILGLQLVSAINLGRTCLSGVPVMSIARGIEVFGTSLSFYHPVHIHPLPVLTGEGAGFDVKAALSVGLDAGVESDDAGVVGLASLFLADDLEADTLNGFAVGGQFFAVLIAALGF